MTDTLESLSRTASAGLPWVRIRGRSFMALVLAPEFPMAAWFAALDAQMRSVPAFFGDRPVVVDLSEIGADPEAARIILDGLEARSLRLVAVEGVERTILGPRWTRLASALPGRETMLDPNAPRPAAAAAGAGAPSLLIDGPVRSGQSIVSEDGDVIVIGAVASGAEVIAGGSIHVYGALRGRAIAGLKCGEASRIFCRRLEAELVGIDRHYRTADHWGLLLHGRPVQVISDRGSLRISAFD